MNEKVIISIFSGELPENFCAQPWARYELGTAMPGTFNNPKY